MKLREKLLKGASVIALGILCTLSISTMTKANTKGTAIDLPMNELKEVEINGSETEWFSFTVPEDIGNQYINVSLENYTDSYQVEMCIQDENGNRIDSTSFISSNQHVNVSFRVEGSKTNYSSTRYLTPGQKYYVSVNGGSIRTEGSIEINWGATPEDNWGSFEKAEVLTVNSFLERKIDDNYDVDCYKFTLPKDGKNYQLVLRSKEDVSISLLNGLGAEQKSEAYTSSETFNLTGDGNSYYVELEQGAFSSGTPSYTLSFLEEVSEPTTTPTATPTAKPTATPTTKPTATPTAKPTATPTTKPTATPTAKPTATPNTEPTTTSSTTNTSVSNNVTNISTSTNINVTKVSSVSVKTSKKAVLLRWKKNAKADGYKIYRSTKKKGGFKCIKTLNGNNKISFTDRKVQRKKTYFYVIKCYKNVGNKIKCSKPSSVKKVRVK